MILYKYFPPSRISVLRDRKIRFTQPGDFNDLYEFRPKIKELAPLDEIKKRLYEGLDDKITEALKKDYPDLALMWNILPPGFIQTHSKHFKENLAPAIFEQLQSQIIAAMPSSFNSKFNELIGVLCLSAVNNSTLMWGHYTDNHSGFAVGFDSESPFFSCRRSDKDDFGFLREVTYSATRPQVTLSNTNANEWFSTKSNHWAYEKEWRIVRVLSEASETKHIEGNPFPICLFEFPADAVREVIFGTRGKSDFEKEVRLLAAGFPKLRFFRARESDSDYELILDDA